MLYFRSAKIEIMSLKAIFKKNTPYSQLMISTGIILLSAILFTFIASTVVMAKFGLSMMQLQNVMQDYSNPLAVAAMKLLQAIASVGTFIIPALLLAWLFHENVARYLALDKIPGIKKILLASLLLICIIPFINFLAELNSRMILPQWMSGIEKWMKDSESSAGKLTEMFLDMQTKGDLIYMIVIVALIPAVGEELLFRGVVQRIFLKWSRNAHVAIWVSAAVFSAVHVQFYGFVPRMLLGAVLGYLMVWSGSLWLSIIAHFVNNTVAVVSIYLFSHGKINVNPDQIGSDSSMMMSILVSILLSAGLLWLIYHEREKSQDLFLEEEEVAQE